jgi:hypothetical protein
LLPNASPLSRASKLEESNKDGCNTSYQLDFLTSDPRIKKLIDGYEE